MIPKSQEGVTEMICLPVLQILIVIAPFIYVHIFGFGHRYTSYVLASAYMILAIISVILGTKDWFIFGSVVSLVVCVLLL